MFRRAGFRGLKKIGEVKGKAYNLAMKPARASAGLDRFVEILAPHSTQQKPTLQLHDNRSSQVRLGSRLEIFQLITLAGQSGE